MFKLTIPNLKGKKENMIEKIKRELEKQPEPKKPTCAVSWMNDDFEF